jgi:large subunit ribosomal protein L35
MPKMKSNRGAAKRFRAKGNGGFKRGQSHRRHILTKKSSKRKRQLGRPAEIAKQDAKSIRRMLPFG